MRRLAIALAASIAAAPAAAATGYADLVDLALAAPLIVRATVVDADRLGARAAPDVPAGRARMLVMADTGAALRAPGPVPARLEYLVDLPLDARGRPPRLKGMAVLLFATPAAGRPGQLRLVSARGQLDAAEEARVRAILTALAKGAPPAVTGVANAFHVPGAIPGEAESQFFLRTERGGPVSLIVLSRPGLAKTLQVATGEVIDEAATGVARETLLWYRLACGLPEALPEGIGDDRVALAADWAFVRGTLGRCDRTP